MWLGADVFPLESTISKDAYVTSQEDVSKSYTPDQNNRFGAYKRPAVNQNVADGMSQQPKRTKSFLQLSKGM